MHLAFSLEPEEQNGSMKISFYYYVFTLVQVNR